MNGDLSGMALLSAMITPAVLISACGTLIFSTSTRLARVVDRVRQLSVEAETLAAASHTEATGERVHQLEGQLGYFSLLGAGAPVGAATPTAPGATRRLAREVRCRLRSADVVSGRPR